MAGDEAVDCPFCGWTSDSGEYGMLLHIETLHSEGESPFTAREDSAVEDSGTTENLDYVECPVDGCGDLIVLQELDYHLELHSQEEADSVQEKSAVKSVTEAAPCTSGPSRMHREAGRHRQSTDDSDKNDRQANAISAWRRLLKMPGSSSGHGILSFKRQQNEKHSSAGHSIRGKRLSKAHLGKYAYEERMPDWLVVLLKKGGQNTSQGVVSVIAQLLEQSTSTKYAYLCHPCIQHVSKLRREGGFCGYRNIQMMFSYIIHTKFKGHEYLRDALPSIFQIQEWIETAWDQGINAHGRAETGGIRGTRKYIGTPEAQAILRLLEIPCAAQAFKHPEPAKSEALLMEHVENYFQSGVEDPSQHIRKTKLPPLFLQHNGHSITIIGFEKERNGAKNLIVFDPSFRDSSPIVRLIGQTFVHPTPDVALKQYRRGTKYLKAYREFEMLRLVVKDDPKPEQ
ncbi:DUF1671-domain-containing protein [Parathielavia appendiculata]|uniref:DUF1671-domain-containing protein n=1 Tax=Parathielavia appendiculata TaxID=2587402 RepID=A0AAN6Z6P3_9PEZI|nr:DUF1671-domain-containing protein [Parathielavia appendiculata]